MRELRFQVGISVLEAVSHRMGDVCYYGAMEFSGTRDIALQTLDFMAQNRHLLQAFNHKRFVAYFIHSIHPAGEALGSPLFPKLSP
jgi:hypothetical protein